MGFSNKTEKIQKWLRVGGVKKFGALTLADTNVFTYSVLLAVIDRQTRSARVNVASYTVTSSGHRNRLLEALEAEDYEVATVTSAIELKVKTDLS